VAPIGSAHCGHAGLRGLPRCHPVDGTPQLARDWKVTPLSPQSPPGRPLAAWLGWPVLPTPATLDYFFRGTIELLHRRQFPRFRGLLLIPTGIGRL
jgi:hypothetical protein